jgi:adenylate kinase
VEQGTELGKKAMPILARGGYLPDDLMCPILADWLSHQSGGWVLDGFPRSLPQALFLDAWLSARNLCVDAVVSLEVPISELLKRIRARVECPECRWSGQQPQLIDGHKCPVCGSPAGPRADDSEANFLSRHAEFVSLTQPVIDHYQAQGLLSAFDATLDQHTVASQILLSFTGIPS